MNESLFSPAMLEWLDGVGQALYEYVKWADTHTMPMFTFSIWDFIMGVFGVSLSVRFIRYMLDMGDD